MSLTDRLTNYASRPVSYRLLLFRNLLRRWHFGSYKARLNAGAIHRPNYGWCVYHAATQAKALGHKAVTVIEFGVAGGNGLLCLCDNSRQIAKEVGIEIRVVGFDSGSGLPASTDRRDILYAWPAGSFRMDRAALERRIGNQAQLVLGNVSETVGAWQPDPQAPLAAVLFDLDYFTSTVSALPVLTKENALPRVWCYFDDICSGPEEAATEGLGEREAIRLFNLSPERETLNDRVSQAYTFKGRIPEPWHQQIYLYHRFSHPDYNRCLTANRDQLQLR
jgi:hypothetical protein